MLTNKARGFALLAQVLKGIELTAPDLAFLRAFEATRDSGTGNKSGVRSRDREAIRRGRPVSAIGGRYVPAGPERNCGWRGISPKVYKRRHAYGGKKEAAG